MIIWIDAQLSPALAPWLKNTFGIDAFSLRYLNMVHMKDRAIFDAAHDSSAVVMTKDDDFVLLQTQLGPPPQILWVRCGNTSNAYLRRILQDTFLPACELLERGEPLVEITDGTGT